MKECSVCHTQNEDSSVFCQDCGTKLEVPAPAAAAPAAPAPAPAAPAAPAAPVAAQPAAAAAGPIICPACQTSNEAGYSFCKSCGVSLTAPAPAPTPAAAAPAPAPAPAETAPAAAPVPTAITGPRLVIAGDPGKGTTFALNKPQINLGRVPEGNDIALPGDGYVSSRHAVITQEGNDFFIEDRGSVNGTYKLLKGKVKLQPGDVIKVGDTNLEFQV